jgi:hypothetical protein
MATVHIPSLLRELTQNAEQVEVDIPPGEKMSVREVLDRLDERFPGIKARLLDETSGELVPELAVFIDGEPAGLGLLAKVQQEDAIFFLAPIVGGA